MKRPFIFIFTLLALILPAKAQVELSDADYYIEGDIVSEIATDANGNRQIVYTLKNLKSNGITFSNTEVINGQKTKYSSSRSYLFENARTECADGFSKGFDMYSLYPYGWQRESEKAESEHAMSNTKTIAIVLVLDCSSSLGDDFKNVKQSAISFINTLAVNSKYFGNVHVGVVAFNDVTKALPIMPLTRDNEEKMKSFIENLTINTNTVVYKAMHEGITMLEHYAKSRLESKNFEYPMLCTFTDGLDNGSDNIDLNITRRTQYFDFLKNNIETNTILGKKIRSCVMSVTGNDVQSDAEVQRIFSQLASEGDYQHLRNYSELTKKFQNIAEDLVERWQNLVCIIPNQIGDDGHFRLVLKCSTPKRRLRFIVGDSVVSISHLSAGAPIEEPAFPTYATEQYKRWTDVPKSMPDRDLDIYASRKEARVQPATSESFGMGVILGSTNALSFKYFDGRSLAFQIDFGSKFLNIAKPVADENSWCSDINLAALAMWQNNVLDVYEGSLYVFAGGGFNMGAGIVHATKQTGFVLGIDAVGGAEFAFKAVPISLGIDFRPGYGYFTLTKKSFFDCSAGVSVRVNW